MLSCVTDTSAGAFGSPALLTDLFLLPLGYQLKKKKDTVQKMGGFQVDNEASMAHKQSRASVMSVQTHEPVGGRARGRGQAAAAAMT